MGDSEFPPVELMAHLILIYCKLELKHKVVFCRCCLLIFFFTVYL